MNSLTAHLRNADRMMSYAHADDRGIQVTFADGCSALIAFADIPEIKDLDNLGSLDLPNPYEVVVRTRNGELVEIPWDFARHYCDGTYRAKVERIGALGRETLGKRIRRARQRAAMTQEALAGAAGIGRVTLVRIERGEQSPRYNTLLAIADSLGCPIQELLVGNEMRALSPDEEPYRPAPGGTIAIPPIVP